VVITRFRCRPHWLVAGALLAVLLVGVTACASTASPTPASTAPGGAAAGPQLSIDKPVVDFGKAAYDQMVQPMWTLTNTGTAPLQIRDFTLDVKEGC